MRYAKLAAVVFGLIVFAVVVRGRGAEEPLPTGGDQVAVKAIADTSDSSPLALAPSPVGSNGEKATVPAWVEEALSETENVTTPQPAPTTAVLEREALTVVPTQAGLAQEESAGRSSDEREPEVAGASPATSTTTPYVAPVQPQGNLTGWLAASPWPQSLWPVVECIVMRESRGQPWQTNLVWPDQSYGLLQINIAPNANPQYGGYDLLNPVVNLAVGWELYQVSGFAPWGGGC